MESEKVWAIIHLISTVLLAAVIAVAFVFAIVYSDLGTGLVILILGAIVVGGANTATFLKMHYDLCYDSDGLARLFALYFCTIFGGLGIWGVVVAIQILCGKED